MSAGDPTGSADARSFLFLVNEAARGGQAVPMLRRLLARAPLQEIPVRVVPFVDDEGVCRALDGLGAEMIPVAAGGDGTVSSVARLLRRAGLQDRPMGLLPLGTGNGVAHSLGLARMGRAAEALVDGRARAIDVMTTTHPQAPISLLNISVGLEARVMGEFQAWRACSRCLAGAIGVGRWSWRRTAGVTVEADGRRLLSPQERIYNVGLYNMPCYGFGVTPYPVADPDDGLADLRLHRGRFSYWMQMGGAVCRAASPFVPRRAWPRVRRVSIATTIPVQVDGEIVSPARFTVAVLPGAVQVLVPA